MKGNLKDKGERMKDKLREGVVSFLTCGDPRLIYLLLCFAVRMESAVKLNIEVRGEV